MGHSDQYLNAGSEAGDIIRVWGDMTNFTLPPEDGSATANETAPEQSPVSLEAATSTPSLFHCTTHEAIDEPPESADLYQRIGHLTRTLHDALRGLGLHDSLAEAHADLPDARDRLSYIAKLTGEAAEKVLNSVDRAQDLQIRLSGHAAALRTRWEAVACYTGNDSSRSTPAGRQLIDETCAFLGSVNGQSDQTKAILTDIMMAQDFHDLTGQVIRKVVELSKTLEDQLVRLLIDATPSEMRSKVPVLQQPPAPKHPEVLEGPVVNAEGRDDVVTDQAGVDDLLASLGF